MSMSTTSAPKSPTTATSTPAVASSPTSFFVSFRTMVHLRLHFPFASGAVPL